MRRPEPTWASRSRRPAAIPTDLVAAAGAVALVWFVLFGLRRGPFWPILLLASAAMLVFGVLRVPRTEDLLLVHQGILVLGVISAVALFVVLLLLGAVTHSISPVHAGLLRAFGRFGHPPAVVAGILVAVAALAEELFWRGYLQGRLAEEFGEQQAFRIALAAYVAVHLFTFNLALIGAAAICGALWGWIRLRTGSLVPGIVSHLLMSWLVYFALPL